MAQHDYNLSNNTGALYRADNNAALQAIVTQNSGATAPSVTFPGMLWLDISGGGDGIMRRRNQANTAWLADIGIDQTARDAAAAAAATANAAMPKSGGTFTGPIDLPGTAPTNNQAVSRAQGDLLYQVRLPTTQAGALLYGAAGGWTGVLAPAANDTLLVVSGGLPTWQTGATTQQPNSYVRTKSDGTIDASLIPAVATGLRFRGTFKPAVNAEYPTTGGSGAAGAPAVGDFWIIDGLTTGGFTYLTGSLAGVTVYNGDSIAKSDGAQWYRMGSVIDVEGYMRVDGSTAMEGDLNLGANYLVDVGGITARAGSPVPLQNFSIDASNVVVSPQRGTTGPDLPNMVTGQLGTDLGRMQIFVGSGGGNTGLLPVRFHSATSPYNLGDWIVRYGGPIGLWRPRAPVSAGEFVANQWYRVMDEAGGTFLGAVQFNGAATIGPSQALFFIRPNGTAAGRIYTPDGQNMNFAVNDAAGNNPIAPLSIRGATADVGITALYVDQRTVANGGIIVRSSSSIESIIFREDMAYNRFYITATGTDLNFNSYADDSATYLGTSLRIGRNPLGVQVLNNLRVWGFGGTDNAAQILFGTTAGLYWSGAQFIFTHEVVAPAFSPTCDARLKDDDHEVVPRALEALAFREYTRKGTTRRERGIFAQDVESIAPEYVGTATGPEGNTMLTVNVAGLALEIALDAVRRVAVLEQQIPHPKDTIQ